MRAHTQVRPYPLFVPFFGVGVYICVRWARTTL